MAQYLNTPFSGNAVSCRFLGFISKPLIETSYKNREIAQETNMDFCLLQSEAWGLFFQDKKCMWVIVPQHEIQKAGFSVGRKAKCAPQSHQRQVLSRYQSANLHYVSLHLLGIFLIKPCVPQIPLRSCVLPLESCREC